MPLTTNDRPVLFIARSWHGHGGMQRLNRDVATHVGGSRTGFQCVHPAGRSVWATLGFCCHALAAALHLRGKNGRVHVADAAALPLGVVCAWLGHMRVSVTACGLDVIYPKRWYQWMIRRCLRQVDQVICISNATAQEVRKRGVTTDRITVIPCGIDPVPAMHTESIPSLIVTVGRLVKRKGVAWFIEHVFPQLKVLHPDLHYVIAGSGPEYRSITSAIRRLHLENAVTVMSGLSDAQRSELLHSASVFVAPNIAVRGDMEGFGIVCLEAAASGVPVAAARIEGVQDAVIDGETGMFFAVGDADGCVQTMHRLLEHPLDSDSVRRAALNRFAWPRLVPLYHDVFNA
jgi:phosphatidyl-myo-inositol dimannoside synthase